MSFYTETKYIFSYYKKENHKITEDINWEVDGSQSVDEICDKFQRFIWSTHSFEGISQSSYDNLTDQLEFEFEE